MGEESGWNGWRVGDWHVPTALAITVWTASALAVLGYTVTAFTETIDTAATSSSPQDLTTKNPDTKPTDRGKFTPSPTAPVPGGLPTGLGL